MANVEINGVVYQDPEKVNLPIENGGGAKQSFYDVSDATAVASDTKSGVTTYGANGKVNGSMPVNGDTSGTISTKDGSVSIPAGHTTGGMVTLSTVAKNSLISSNIKSGATVMGVNGDPMVVDTTIATGGATSATMLNGAKAFVNGTMVTGSATVPSVSWDSVTHILTIS